MLKKFSLSKNERVKLKRDFLKVYSQGSIFYSSQKKIKLNYYVKSSVNDFGVKAAFVVSKKAGNAVWRNRIKRLFREAYRLNKFPLQSFCASKKVLLLLIFSPAKMNQKENGKVKLDFIIDDFVGVLDKLKSKIENA